jgi:thiol-disulfide isomerase/thioredoxin
VVLACLVVLTVPWLASFAHAEGLSLRAADAKAILAEIGKPGAKAVLVNVWATWCEPCRDEMPSLLRFYREHREDGLRLFLISVDDEADRDRVVAFLTSQGIDFPTWLKRGDDQSLKLMRALDPEWSGILPASFLFKNRGKSQYRWYGTVDDQVLRMLWGQGRRRRKGRADHRRTSRSWLP